MSGRFIIESEELSQSETARLEDALTGIADADAPLVCDLVFLSGDEIRTLNLRERGIDAVTDVLSFPSMDGIKGKRLIAEEHRDCIDEEGRLVLGSIAICKERAEEQAREYGHSVEREFNYLTVHGVLHCLGYDHMTEDEKNEMRETEERVMARMNLQRN